MAMPSCWRRQPLAHGRRRARCGERGQETLQAILVVALVLLPMLVGILTFSTLVHASIATQAAAAAGARAAGVAGEFGEDQLGAVVAALRSNDLDANACVISSSAGTVRLDQPIRITVQCPEHVGIPFLFERDVQLTSTVVGRGEVNR
jgi:Flp pilus assembly protein TadG